MKLIAKGPSQRRSAVTPRGSRRVRPAGQVSAAELKRQCGLANAADKRDNWRQFVFLPSSS